MATATGVIDHVVRPHVALTEDKYLRGPASAGPGEAFLPATMPPGVARIVTNVLALFAARDMAQHCTPMPMFARDVVWDAPPFLLRCARRCVCVSSCVCVWGGWGGGGLHAHACPGGVHGLACV
jgi:hypothetical protein